jgi:hypothetical protein
VLNGSVPIDVSAIATEVARQGNLHGGGINLASAVLLVCWIGSIVDGYLLARR